MKALEKYTDQTTMVKRENTIEFVTAEYTSHGFTNWRVTITIPPEKITCTDCRVGQHVWEFWDLLALRCHLGFGRHLANKPLAKSYAQAFGYISENT